MNTLSDTDEEKARPSVWPVYVAAAVLGGAGLLTVAAGVTILFVSPEDWGWGLIAVPVGAFHILVAFGLLRLRPWAWWCGILWLCGGGLSSLWYIFSNPPALLYEGVSIALTTGLPVWVLATRRQLFFRPKPEREE